MPKHSTKVPFIMQQHYNAITELTDKFCQQAFNEEYQQLVRYATAALCRKKPRPILTGYINTWAGAIIYAVGSVNFLFDKSNLPFVSGAELAQAFHTSKSTLTSKAKQVRDILRMRQLDHTWCLPSKIGDSPLVWMISFNGFIVDARTLPREIQKVAYQKGLIPYVFADKLLEIS